MRNNSRLDEANKPKNDQQIAMISSVKEIQRVTDANQLRLQHLELAVANLTSICSIIRNDMYSLSSSSNYDSYRRVQAEAIEMKRRTSSTRMRSSSPCLNLKDDVLGVQMKQLVKQAAALGILKDSRTSSLILTGDMKANSKTPTSTKPALKKLQATTKTAPMKVQATTKTAPKKVQATKKQKSSTKLLVESMDSTTEKKMSMKVATGKNHNMGASQLSKAKRPPEKNADNKATATTKVSLESTVRNTKTTISKVYVNQSAAKKSKETTVKNVETTQDKGSIKLTIKAHDQGHKSQNTTAVKSHAATDTNSSPGTAKSDLRPRRKWSTPERKNSSEVKESLGIYGSCQSI
ncbi:uncharacterized protein LOC104900460 [Beta vulgaris subsp. vulgaris]|uniref:uncharacterized protein LOC104900460 n=1 Tax=Beta vulgaris subsp. vulgaris TaxID=3555 RepID=UPI002036DC84|nr:uncharacterized protein LOC104900460 [Beta vulgaris subsp. vulgaris]